MNVKMPLIKTKKVNMNNLKDFEDSSISANYDFVKISTLKAGDYILNDFKKILIKSMKLMEAAPWHGSHFHIEGMSFKLNELEKDDNTIDKVSYWADKDVFALRLKKKGAKENSQPPNDYEPTFLENVAVGDDIIVNREKISVKMVSESHVTGLNEDSNIKIFEKEQYQEFPILRQVKRQSNPFEGFKTGDSAADYEVVALKDIKEGDCILYKQRRILITSVLDYEFTEFLKFFGFSEYERIEERLMFAAGELFVLRLKGV